MPLCKGSPIYTFDYAKTFKFKWSGLPKWNKCYGAIVYNGYSRKINPQNKYMGEWKEGLYHGIGTYFFTDPRYNLNTENMPHYIGEWKLGKRHGKGKIYNNYSVQEGIWEQGHHLVGSAWWYESRDREATKKKLNDTVLAYESVPYDKNNFQKKKTEKKEQNTIVADNNNRQNEQNQKAVERERRKRELAEREKEQLEKELAELKAKKKEEKENVASDTKPPQIAITSSNVEDKQGIIEGVVLDNIEVAELTINGEQVKFDKEGNFSYSTFIPQNGKELILQATDSKGLSNEKIVALQRKEISTERILSFTELNPLKLKGKKNENAFALIIGVNNYLYAPNALYADRDASYFADFVTNVMGITRENIKTLSNTKASQTEIKIALKRWLKGYSAPNKSDIFVFFAGHGLASTDGKELYLLPYDGEPRLLEDTALLRSDIFNTIKNMNPRSVTVFLDACYSGQTREENMILADARPITIAYEEDSVPEGFTIFSASSGSEISGSLPEAYHGLFSYFLMKGLEGDADSNNDKKITTGELHNYVYSNVTRQAIRLGREQTPQLQGDEDRVLVEFN